MQSYENRDIGWYLSFFKRALTENLLSFWMSRCLDRENGGYFNCFSNDGSRLVSTDKYTWSQGRFLWMFSRLASMESDMFDSAERELFLKYAKSGRDFLLYHALVDPLENEPRCVFLTDAKGAPQKVGNHEGYDLSISADCFVVMGFAAYARVANDRESWLFAKRLGESVFSRYESLNCRTLPYPVSPKYISHARPMILTNVSLELYYTTKQFEESYTETLLKRLEKYHREIFETFMDENYLVHEFRFAKKGDEENLFTSHINPGHTLEDMWFQIEAASILGCDDYLESVGKVVKSTMNIGWDEEYGGLLHFVPCDGLETKYKVGDAKDEPQMQLFLDDWGSKLWWVHSEAMYTTLLTYFKTNDTAFLHMFRKVFDYTFSIFPNPDESVGEWIQIRTRRGEPQEKVVALPVKDPYHIIRNVILIIELLEREEKKMSTELFKKYRKIVEQAWIPIFVKDNFDTEILLSGCRLAGIKVIEYTLRRADANEVTPHLRNELSDTVILMGSTIDSEEIANERKRKFPQIMTLSELAPHVDGFVSMLPFSDETLERYRDTHLCIPTAETGGEALRQVKSGAAFIKVIGPDFTFSKRLHAQPTFDYCPTYITGGVTVERMSEAFAAGNILTASGFDVVLKGISPDVLTPELVAEKITAFVSAAKAARAEFCPSLFDCEELSDEEFKEALPNYCSVE